MRSLAFLFRLSVLALLSFLSLSASRLAQADGKKKEPAPSASQDPNLPPLNACGCYEDSSGSCHCTKKSKCGCPGECEPAGCEAKRDKELNKETQQELKKQQDEDKKRNAELEKKREELEKKDSEKTDRGLRGLRLIEDKK